MGQDGSEVRERGQHDEGADEGVECRLVADVDASEQSTDDCTKHDRVKWIPLFLIDVSEEAAEGRSIVASKGPEYAAGG